MSGYVKQYEGKKTGIYTELGFEFWNRGNIVRGISRHHGKRDSLSDAMQMQGFACLYGRKANLSRGLSGLREMREVRADDVQSDNYSVVWISQTSDEFFKAVECLVRYREHNRRLYRNPMKSSAVPPKLRAAANPGVQSDIELAPERVLRRLQSSGLDDSESGRLVIEAEVLDFSGDQAAHLVVLLRQFIDARRESNTMSDLVAVASAIRKFIATAGPEEAFDYAASLLRAGGRSPLPIDLELEVSKMVVRKLTASHPARNDCLSDLAIQLNELSETYLNPRLLAREKHGAVALNAVIGLVLTRDRVAKDVIGQIRGLGVTWFQQLVGRRASRLKTELENRSSGDRFGDLLQSLDELSATVSESKST